MPLGAANAEALTNVNSIRRYMTAVVRFREMLVLVHITGGQPARGPELLSIRHANTVSGVDGGTPSVMHPHGRIIALLLTLAGVYDMVFRYQFGLK